MIDQNLRSLSIAPKLLPSDSAWIGHIPFACFLTEILDPKVFVELGTHSGSSYFSICQTIQELDRGESAHCWAVDTWEGDPQAQYDGAEVFLNVNQHNSDHYSGFSTLLRGTFDEALSEFEDGTVDLLHIDGYHTYDAVKKDYETWCGKLSKTSVVLFHDTNEYQRDFGVWKFWEEVRQGFPHFQFRHEHGLGVLLTGSNLPSRILELPKQEHGLQKFFFDRALDLREKVHGNSPPNPLVEQIEILTDSIAGFEAENKSLRTKNEKLKDQLKSVKETSKIRQVELSSAKSKLKELQFFVENSNSISFKIAKPFVKLGNSFSKRLGGEHSKTPPP